MWTKELARHPNRELAHYICQGITEGFRVGYDYQGSRCRKAAGNMQSVREHREVVEWYIQGERAMGRLLGPLNRESFHDVHVYGVPYVKIFIFCDI